VLPEASPVVILRINRNHVALQKFVSLLQEGIVDANIVETSAEVPEAAPTVGRISGMLEEAGTLRSGPPS
jgi:hypothetical protein